MGAEMPLANERAVGEKSCVGTDDSEVPGVRDIVVSDRDCEAVVRVVVEEEDSVKVASEGEWGADCVSACSSSKRCAGDVSRENARTRSGLAYGWYSCWCNGVCGDDGSAYDGRDSVR